MTNEHVWSDWFRRYLPDLPVGRSERWSSNLGRQNWRSPLLTSTVKDFCEPCNTGWMSGIEGVAEPIVGPMFQGLAVRTLNREEPQIVATWTVLKAKVATRTSAQPSIPERHWRDFYLTEDKPGDTVSVWLAHWASLRSPVYPFDTMLFDSHFMPLAGVNGTVPVPDKERTASRGTPPRPSRGRSPDSALADALRRAGLGT